MYSTIMHNELFTLSSKQAPKLVTGTCTCMPSVPVTYKHGSWKVNTLAGQTPHKDSTQHARDDGFTGSHRIVLLVDTSCLTSVALLCRELGSHFCQNGEQQNGPDYLDHQEYLQKRWQHATRRATAELSRYVSSPNNAGPARHH